MSDTSENCAAIIGAGVSGLVAAAHLYRVGIRPVVFDKAAGIGGMWNVHLTPSWKSMQTNISKFTTVLTDCPWPEDTPLFPNQAEVYSYLCNYARHALPKNTFQLSTEVTQVRCSDNEALPWIVEYRTRANSICMAQFKFMIVASGFFGTPHIPDNIRGLSRFPGQLLHSSDYRSSDQVRDKRVIIVGASMSAAEIAADIAPAAKQIIHIASRNFWSLPRFIPLVPKDPSSAFLPVDLVAYRRSKRASNNETIFRNAGDYKKITEYYQTLTGGSNQRSSRLVKNKEDEVPFVAISNTYDVWNRAGRITLQQGPLREVQVDGTLVLNNGTTIESSRDDVLILCTGYQPCFDFFSKTVLEQLSYRSTDLFCPVILHRCIFHPSLTNLAFIGMYRGVYWTIIELQARWVAAIFSGRSTGPSLEEQQDGLDLEHRVRAQDPRPQFPHVDYVGMANDLAREVLGAVPSTDMDLVLPMHYSPGEADQIILEQINSLCQAAHAGRFVAGAVFRALHESRWKFERTITDQNSRGEARFGSLKEPSHLLYTESTGHFDPLHKYIYVYDEAKDLISVHFHIDGELLGAMFHTIRFERSQSSPSGWVASDDYRLDRGHCSITYLFVFDGIYLSRFELTFVVKGSANDYTSTTVFQSEDLPWYVSSCFQSRIKIENTIKCQNRRHRSVLSGWENRVSIDSADFDCSKIFDVVLNHCLSLPSRPAYWIPDWRGRAIYLMSK